MLCFILIMSINFEELPKPMFIMAQYHRKPDQHKKNIYKMNDNGDIDEISLDQINMKPEDLVMFFAQTPQNYKVKNIRTQYNITQGTVMEDEKKLYTYKIDSDNKIANIRYYGFGGADNWVFLDQKLFKTIMYDIYIYVSGTSIEEQVKHMKDGHTYYHLHHPYRVICKFLSNKSTTNVNILLHSQNLKVPKPASPHLTEDFFKKYNGYLKIVFTSNELYKITYKQMDNKIRRIHSFVFLFSNFRDIINDANCVELDASFYVFRPYVYAIFEIIIKNESYPIGLSIGPSECSVLYENLYNLVREIDENIYNILIRVPILSDEGSGLISFGKKFNLRHFFCFRHILNKIGLNSPLCGIVKSLLFSRNYEEFLYIFKIQYDVIISLLKKGGEKKIKQFCNLFNVTFECEKLSIPKEDDLQQCLWRRIEWGVPSCSNHSEATHSRLNIYCEKLRNFPTILEKVLDFMLNKQAECKNRRNLREYIAHFKHSDGPCHCLKDDFKNKLFGEILPCCHNYENFSFEPLKYYPLLETHMIYYCENQTSWDFKEIKKLPNYEISGSESLILTIYGKPNMEKLKFVTDSINIDDINKKTIYKYIRDVFISFSALHFGFYDYGKETLAYFNKYVRNLVYDEKHDILIKYPISQRTKNIELLIELINNVDITQSIELNLAAGNDETNDYETEVVETEVVEREVVETKDDETERSNSSNADDALMLKQKILESVDEMKNYSPKTFLENFFKKTNKWKKEYNK